MRKFTLIAITVISLAAGDARAQYYGDPTTLVSSWYRNYLGREPDQGMYGWVNQLNQGVPADQVLAGILASPEFYNRGGGTPQGFITQLYQAVLGRNPNPRELSYWINRMYTDDRSTIADTLLVQNPGVWIGSGGTAQATPPPVPNPPPPVQWNRDRYSDWNRRNDIFDYRRPSLLPYYAPKR